MQRFAVGVKKSPRLVLTVLDLRPWVLPSNLRFASSKRTNVPTSGPHPFLNNTGRVLTRPVQDGDAPSISMDLSPVEIWQHTCKTRAWLRNSPAESENDPFQKSGIDIDSVNKFFIAHNLLVEGNRGFDSFDNILIKSGGHFLQGLVAGLGMNDKFADH